MLRKIEKIEGLEKNQLIIIFKRIEQGIISMINDYGNLYNEIELNDFNKLLLLLNNQINDLENDRINVDNINKNLEIELYLKKYIFKTWQYENLNGGSFISWFKNERIGNVPKLISSTFSYDYTNSYCGATVGIKYNVDEKAFLGALEKDAAVLLNDVNNIYTIGKIEDKYVNSYNLATPIITPKQVLKNDTNYYKSKHNEIILDSKYIIPKSVICLSKGNDEFAEELASKIGVHVEYVHQIEKKNL